MKKVTNILLLIIAIFSFIKCKELIFQPTDENNVNITKPDLNLDIDISEIEDTAYVSGISRFHYSLDLNGKVLYRVEGYINNELVTYTSSSNNISLDSRKFPDGVYILKLLPITYSDANSLAARLGVEFVYTSIEFIIKIENDILSTPVKIIETNDESGKLKIIWNKYKYHNFKEYRMYLIIRYENGNESKKLLTSINSVDSLEYFDESFIGGLATYQVNVLTLENNEIIGEEYSVNKRRPEIVAWEILENDKIKLVWNRCDYDSSFSEYILYWQKYASIENTMEYIKFPNINDTSYIHDSWGFGSERNYYISTKSKNNNYIDSKKVDIYIGNPFPKFSNLKYLPSLNSIYLIDNNSTVRLNAYTHEVLASCDKIVQISHDGLRAFSLVSNYTIEEIDPLTLQKISTISSDKIFGEMKPISKISSGIQSNIIYIDSDSLYYVDINSLNIISHLPSLGKYVFINMWATSFYGNLILTGVSGTNVVNILKVDLTKPIIDYSNGIRVLSGYQINFSYENDYDMIIDTYGNQIWTSKYIANEITETIYFDTEENILFPSKDPFSNLVGGLAQNDDYYVIYDYKNKNLKYKIKTPNFFSNPSFTILKNRLYSGHGFYMDLK